MKISSIATALLVINTVSIFADELNFIGLGDWGGAMLKGYHEQDQLAVAKQMTISARQNDVKFVVNVGDNFYYFGIDNLEDPQIQTDFENVYADESLFVPWYSTLGNHDYGLNVSAQLMYKSPNNDRWVMPDRYYTKRLDLGMGQYATFVYLDTNPCVWSYRDDDPGGWDPSCYDSDAPKNCRWHQNILDQNCRTQYEWLKDTVARIPQSDWKIAVGHHNAYEIDVDDLTSVLQKSDFHLYMNGHTHALAQYQVDGKGAYVLTGAGCMVHLNETAFQLRSNPSPSFHHSHRDVWYSKTAGFTLHTFNDDRTQLTTTFVDYAGNTLHSFTVSK